MIKPTIGRVVWVCRPLSTSDINQAEIGFVTYVWSDRSINVAGFDHHGNYFRLNSLLLIQDDEPKPEGDFACWMPYQKAVAAGEIPTTKHAQSQRDLNFGQALELLKQGQLVGRSGWNGKGMFLFMVPGSTFKANRPPLLGIYPEGTEIKYHGHVDMKTATGDVVPWLCSQTDMLAEDWEVVKFDKIISSC